MAKINAGCFRKLRIAALVIMAAGLLLLVCNLPGWVWGTGLGILLISAGFLLWRFF